MHMRAQTSAAKVSSVLRKIYRSDYFREYVLTQPESRLVTRAAWIHDTLTTLQPSGLDSIISSIADGSLQEAFLDLRAPLDMKHELGFRGQFAEDVSCALHVGITEVTEAGKRTGRYLVDIYTSAARDDAPRGALAADRRWHRQVVSALEKALPHEVDFRDPVTDRRFKHSG